MQEFSEIIKTADIEAAGMRPNRRPAGRQQETACPICGGSGYILRSDGRAQLCRCHAGAAFSAGLPGGSFAASFTENDV